MKSKFRTFALMSLLLGMVAGFTHAPVGQPPLPPSQEQLTQKFIQCFRDEFNPTDEQLDTLKNKILKGEDPQSAGRAVEAKKSELERLLESDANDATLLAQFNQIEEVKKSLATSHFLKMLTLRSILTPEQRSHFCACRRKLAPKPPGGPIGT